MPPNKRCRRNAAPARSANGCAATMNAGAKPAEAPAGSAAMSRKKKITPAKTAEAVLKADAAAVDRAEQYRDTRLVRVTSLLSEVGDQPPMRALCLSALALGAMSGSPRLMRAGARMIAAHTLATWAKDFVKTRVDRTRPRSRNGRKGHKPKKGRNHSKEETSFPSGHSAGAIAVAQAYAREFPEHKSIALAGAGAIAIAQIPRCAHYPTDVGSGLAIGLASEALVDWLVEALQLSGEEDAE